MNLVVLAPCYLAFLLVSLGFFSTANATDFADCQSCHRQQYQDWLSSDHRQAMQPANRTTVKGDFNNAHATHYQLSARFYRKDGEYWARLSKQDQAQENRQTSQVEQAQHYQFAYTFGHYPLQQYLVKTANGKMQVFPFAWDSRAAEQGGQRWFHIYQEANTEQSAEQITEQDRLHWLQPLQNWNGMCADCHSDGFQRNYNAQKDSFDSKWQADNVGCQSCHAGYQQAHSKVNPQAQVQSSESASSKVVGSWQRNQLPTAQWQGTARKESAMWNCFACHSLRTPLTDGFSPNEHFLNQFSPSLLNAPLYHADGQIKEEVYVMGSFLQSKMYRKGVQCVDCHNPHSGKVKIDGNGLCLQCHSPQVFNDKTHHGHSDNSQGAQCVNCHMPTTTYMGVDARRDHSFKVPNPKLAKQFDTPLACLTCHPKQNADWAQMNIASWQADSVKSSQQAAKHQLAFDYASFIAGKASHPERLARMLDDPQLPDIQKASLLAQVPYLTQSLPGNWLARYLQYESPLIRMAAANLGSLLSSPDKQRYMLPMLADQFKAVRIAALSSLLGTHIPAAFAKQYAQVFNELSTAQAQVAWRGEGRVNIAQRQLAVGQTEQAINQLTQAIAIDPYFEASYINLADIYRNITKVNEEVETYQQGLAVLPKSATLHYAMALSWVRQQQYRQALTSLAQATQLAPNEDQYHYTYALALEKVAGRPEALSYVQQALVSLPQSVLLRNLEQYFMSTTDASTDNQG
ncbi:ammonia-forming cytochrome c nitrite reductase subunit c552 [Thalassotalea euphylliae]|uniref:Ammonia-forming cytochrome c nitrite reductase subunit c552 n=1 Tax=Thalassotalea euphylliae TaxID=1655234 RepID=A0A3E0UCL9_9GAMM|nr:ammonia-forming cytochrome c nitrite reductase subunit c552 [Thalassotalea euphylliae]REL34333.1 ammonia-forming cytochrome c nitrite reductase subunit c552 [Thalassotalea euphylliae]